MHLGQSIISAGDDWFCSSLKDHTQDGFYPALHTLLLMLTVLFMIVHLS